MRCFHVTEAFFNQDKHTVNTAQQTVIHGTQSILHSILLLESLTPL